MIKKNGKIFDKRIVTLYKSCLSLHAYNHSLQFFGHQFKLELFYPNRELNLFDTNFSLLRVGFCSG